MNIGEFLLQLAAEAIAPVVRALPAVAGFAAEKAVNFFGPPIAKRFCDWLRGKPRMEQEEVLVKFASVPVAKVAPLALESFRQQAPNADPKAIELAIRYLSAIPGSVRRSLVSVPGQRALSLPFSLDLQQPDSLLSLLPISAPPFAVPGDLPGSNYYLEEVIGTGGFGAVYRARSKDATQQFLRFAIKVCLDPEMLVALTALQNELENLKRLQEAPETDWPERIVKLFGYRLDSPPPFLVYEFVPGGDLASYLLRRQQEMGGRVGPDEVRGWILQIVEGLAFAHSHGLIHRDLKPANVLVNGSLLKLTDFGLGRVVADHARAHSQIRQSVVSQLPPDEQVSLFRGAGTPLYMSPQQRKGHPPDRRHDLYSLGVMWFQLLLGNVTEELPHNPRKVLSAKCPGAGDQIDLIERCLDCCEDWNEDGLKSAEQLLGLMKKPWRPPSSIRIEALHPQPVTVAPGSSGAVMVRVVRQNFDGELTVGVQNLPAPLRFRASRIREGGTESQVHLIADQNAAPGTASAQIIVHGNGGVEDKAALSVQVTSPMPPSPLLPPGGIWPTLAPVGLPGNIKGVWLVYLDSRTGRDPQWWHFSWGWKRNPDPFCLTPSEGAEIRNPRCFSSSQEIWSQAVGRMPCSTERGISLNRGDDNLASFWKPELDRLNHTVKVGELLLGRFEQQFSVRLDLLSPMRWYPHELHLPPNVQGAVETDPYVAAFSSGQAAAGQRPLQRRVELLVEVRRASLQYARQRNFPAEISQFARTGVPEIWVVDLNADKVDVYRQPQGGRYTAVSSFDRRQMLNPQAAPAVNIAVDDLLP
jgi:serine/threonine protein kinase